jgi:rhodanese-related sulfurtransferase
MRHRRVHTAGSLTLAALLLAACASATPLPSPEPGPTALEASIDSLLDKRFQSFLETTPAYGALGQEEFRKWLKDDPPPFVLDVRTQAEAEATGHIAGAVRIPLEELASRTALLPGFDTTIVTYCGSGWRCTMALPVLAALGWESVYTLKDESLKGWIRQGFPVVHGAPPEPPPSDAASPDPLVLAHMQTVLSSLPEDDGAVTPRALAQALKDGEDLVLLDIRALSEIMAKGFIRSDRQLRISIDELTARRGELPEDRSTRIVAYCGSGYRCLLATMMLRAYGYTSVGNLVGGLEGWQAEGFPIEAAN